VWRNTGPLFDSLRSSQNEKGGERGKRGARQILATFQGSKRSVALNEGEGVHEQARAVLLETGEKVAGWK